MNKEDFGKHPFALVVLLATTFLPVSDQFNIIKMLLIFFLCILNKRCNPTSFAYTKGKQVISLWFTSIFISTFAVILIEKNYNHSIFIHEITRLIYYLLIINLCTKINVDLKFLFYCCAIVLSLHFVIQLTQYLRLGIFDNFIETYYLSGNTENLHYQLAINKYYAFRSGSIFINPNVYVCYPYLSLGVFLEYNRRTKSILPLVMIVIAFLSIVLTGSRMGLGAFIIIIAWYLIFKPIIISNEVKRQQPKIVLFVSIILIFLFFNWGKVLSSLDGMRVFSLDEAYEGSGSTKLAGFAYYLSHTNPLYWFTGSLGSNSLNVQIDMELGYVFTWFGILGILWYTKLLKTIYYNNSSEFKVISSIATLSILLTAIGASSVLNMSVFPYICSISLTNIEFNSNK